jgi:pilus assembly protein Flp/PilA
MLSRMANSFLEFLRTEDGPTAVEYAVMLALIVVICLVAITALGTSANSTFGNIALTTAAAGGT